MTSRPLVSMASLTPLDLLAPQGRSIPTDDLLNAPQVRHLLSLVRVRMGFPQESFDLSVRPMCIALLHISTGGPDDSGWLVPALHQGIRALDRRRERILPPQVAPEALGEHAPAWTYAVFVAALLRGMPLPTGQNAWQVFERTVPPPVFLWLIGREGLMPTLEAVLSGRPRPGNPIAELLRAIDAPSPTATASVVAPGERTSRAPAPLPSQPFPQPPSAVPVQSSGDSPPERADTLPGVAPWPPGDGGAFVLWVREGLGQGRLACNSRDALVHRVANGWLLVSPGLFRAYLAREGAAPSSQDPAALKRLQREVLRLSWHLKGEGGITLHGYEWAQGARNPVHGLVLTEVSRLLDASAHPDPGPNPALFPLASASPSPTHTPFMA
jgi:hypothetical protein